MKRYMEWIPAHTSDYSPDGYAWRVSLWDDVKGTRGRAVKLSRPRCECGNYTRLCHPEA